ncbi:hypothetical protein DOTSEDRAFT_28821 [Dothistroma septosporum NZE10]|uniref:SnoaL-like domain-containing protein n=1 Tax=Dothistroma septosporum (strain NZE10 / CBS 128990) TaxID=675120 RepID=M2XJS2_DOTSN|nr:hypothetical protein DOTSEDRAFT_28821 [Dothistroma septosporum NZE10]
MIQPDLPAPRPPPAHLSPYSVLPSLGSEFATLFGAKKVKMIEEDVQDFFNVYQKLSQQALDGKDNLDKLTDLFAPQFIYSSPYGVEIGDNRNNITHLIRSKIHEMRGKGQKQIEIDSMEVIIVDEVHAMPKITWEATYDLNGRTVKVKYVIGYMLKYLDGVIRLFGWMATGDQDDALRKVGIRQQNRMSL